MKTSSEPTTGALRLESPVELMQRIQADNDRPRTVPDLRHNRRPVRGHQRGGRRS